MPRIIPLAACVLIVLAAGSAHAAPKVPLRNCVDPELLTTHAVSILLARHGQRGGVAEDSLVRVRSLMIRAHLDEANPGQVKVADMLAMQPGEVVRVVRGGKPVEPPPRPEEFNLSPATAQFYTRVQTLSDGPAETPWPRSMERVVVGLLLDVAHWPRDSVEVGQNWTRPIEQEEFSGVQSFTLKGTRLIAGEAVAIVEATIDGQFRGAAASHYAFERAAVRLVWSREDRLLLQLVGKAAYARLQDDKKEPHELTVDVALKKRERLSDEDQTAVRRSLTDLAAAMAECQAERFETAVAACARYREKWPDSVWMPAVADVENRAVLGSQAARSLTRQELAQALTDRVAAWHAAASAHDGNAELRARRAIASLCKANDAAVRAMLVDADETLRSLAAFAWAFGESPDHLVAVVAAARDPAARVRAWAAEGLAVRGDPLTDPDVLRRLLNDEDAQVRARGCAAAATCRPRGAPISGMLRDLLYKAARDGEPRTRIAAARALGEAGGPADVKPLRDVLFDEKNPAVREALVRAISRLEKHGS